METQLWIPRQNFNTVVYCFITISLIILLRLSLSTSRVNVVIATTEIQSLSSNAHKFQRYKNFEKTKKVSKKHQKTEQTIKDLQNCSVGFAPTGTFLPPVGLVSFPGCGNTWTRHLIEISTGVFTGSIYHDVNIQKSGMIGEWSPLLDGRTLTIKSHWSKSSNATKLKASTKNCIFLIRNPRDAILSELNFELGGFDHTKRIDFEKEIRDKRFRFKTKLKYMMLAKNYWNTYQGYLKSCYKEGNVEDGIFKLEYERLKEKPFEYTLKIKNWLNSVYPGRIPDRKECLKDSEGDFHRQNKKDIDYSWIVNKLLAASDLRVLDGLKGQLLNNSYITFPENYKFY